MKERIKLTTVGVLMFGMVTFIFWIGIYLGKSQKTKSIVKPTIEINIKEVNGIMKSDTTYYYKF